jgi:hypothetical protein
MVAPTCFGVTLPSSGSVPRAFWEMLNWETVDRTLWMCVLCLVTLCVVCGARTMLPTAVSRNRGRSWNVLSVDTGAHLYNNLAPIQTDVLKTYFGLGQGCRTPVRARARIGDNFRRNSFLFGRLNLPAAYFRLFKWRLRSLYRLARWQLPGWSTS